MSTELAAFALLNERFLIDYPGEAARVLETLPIEANVELLRSQSSAAVLRSWQMLPPDRGADVLAALPTAAANQLLIESDPQACIAALAHLPTARCDALLALLSEQQAAALRELMQYPQGTVGNVMDPRVAVLDIKLTVAAAAERLRSLRLHGLRDLFVVDEQLQLVGQIDMEDLVLSARERPIQEFTRSVAVVLRDSDTVAKAVTALQQQAVDVLPVVNEQGRFKGVVRLSKLTAAVRRRSWWRSV
jgi:magnesium transporter